MDLAQRNCVAYNDIVVICTFGMCNMYKQGDPNKKPLILV